MAPADLPLRAAIDSLAFGAIFVHILTKDGQIGGLFNGETSYIDAWLSCAIKSYVYD